ncbi:MBL fold metallo-hydrolase [Rhodobacter sp. KR11]|uniref:MBL fold metallo-hydrolase n=1 Tax=Rhodobacter sp. KR11 TaxID=2974588 RepID=UPI0022239D83|nr:MBL fold metallo-hydrolase [Rhodobacter sp. KR11]MCW1919894.1 MBL fold metallo-hydrolase [Rhodobacter sp. KR11]
MTRLTRRMVLASGAAASLTPFLAQAQAPMLGASTPLHYRFTLGAFEVTPLLAGTGTRDKPQETFGLNATPEEFAALSAENLIPADRSQNFFTPTLVNTGKELVLFDTGLNPEGLLAALTSAGYTADQVDVVVLTHMHGDHIGGIAGAAGVTFAKARYVTGAIEHNHWSGAANEGFDKLIKPLNDKFTFLDAGQDVVSGITSVEAYGHTPGHFAYHIESAGQRLMLTADMTNHAVWSLARPDWEVKFDMDKTAAATTRRRILGQLAADKTAFVAYHLPFPALGYVETRGEGFAHIPMSYQLIMG